MDDDFEDDEDEDADEDDDEEPAAARRMQGHSGAGSQMAGSQDPQECKQQ